MYLTSQRVEVSQTRAITSFLYTHKTKERPDPRDVEEILGRDSTEGLELLRQEDHGIKLGGNKIISYLDIVGSNSFLDSCNHNSLRRFVESSVLDLAGSNLPYLSTSIVKVKYNLVNPNDRKTIDFNIIDDFKELLGQSITLLKRTQDK